MVILQRDRRGARVLRNLEALARQLSCRLRQGEVIIVADHALHFDQLLLAHVLEDDVQDGHGQLQRAAQAMQVAKAFDQHPAQHQVQHQRLGNA